MAGSHDHDRIPKPILVGAALLLALTIGLSAFSRHTGHGTVSTPVAKAVDTRNLHFADRKDGSVLVTDADTGQTVFVAEPGTNGFLRGVMRGMSRVRKLEKISRYEPYRLIRWDSGRISLLDPTTGSDIKLEVFGPANYSVFARLLTREVAHLTKTGRTLERKIP